MNHSKFIYLRFRTKQKDGTITRPDFTPQHVYGPEHYNRIQLDIALRRAKQSHPDLWPPKILDVSNLPPNVSIISAGFLHEIQIELPKITR